MSSFNAAMYGQSPPSSAVESTEGTPDTRFTAFSPEDIKPSKPVNAVGVAAQSAGTAAQDPFISAAPRPKAGQKLSPTASAFQPFGQSFNWCNETVSIPVVAHNASSGAASGSGAAGPVPGTIQYLDQVVAAHANSVAQTQSTEATSFGTFSTDTGATRCIKVSAIYDKTDVPSLIGLTLEKLKKIGFTVTGKQRIQNSGTTVVYARFSNIFEAAKIYTTIKLDHPVCAVEYIGANAFGLAVTPNHKNTYSAHEGQVVLTASYPSGIPFNKKEFEESLRALLSAEGDLYAWQKLLATEAGTFRMVAEFVDSQMAPRAVARCDGKQIEDVMVKVEMHTPDVTSTHHRVALATTPTRRSGDRSGVADLLNRISLGNTPAGRFGSNSLPNSEVSVGLPNNSMIVPARAIPVAYTSANVFGVPSASMVTSMYQNSLENPYEQQYQSGPLRQYYGTYGANLNPMNPYYFSQVTYGGQEHRYFLQPQFNRPVGRRPAIKGSQGHVSQGNMTRGRQHTSSAAGHHNQVDTERIRRGIDVRTTVMLRNIPNKVDQSMLKEIVDESSHGRVGYAFINFVDPLDIIDFVEARSDQKWHRFKSDKVAEVSYATIQGRDCLIQKFRNSSVMLEPAHYRPKLFFTINDPYGRAGQEDQFPASDNASKLKRSCENAEHVGLFAPSAGQHMRDEQRRRRSQYDRGTSLAEREEFGFGEDGEFDLHIEQQINGQGYPY